MNPPPWRFRRRLLLALVGTLIAIPTLVLGATILAAGATSQLTGAAVATALLLATPVGIYLLTAGLWGDWLPVGEAMRVRTTRLALVWSLASGLFILSGLPLMSPSQMSRGELTVAITLALLLGIIVFGITAVRSKPRATSYCLLVAATYAGLTLLVNLGRGMLRPNRGQLIGPAPALSLLLAASFAAALVVGAFFAWLLRSSSLPAPPNDSSGTTRAPPVDIPHERP